jgi:hypothetical protein
MSAVVATGWWTMMNAHCVASWQKRWTTCLSAASSVGNFGTCFFTTMVGMPYSTAASRLPGLVDARAYGLVELIEMLSTP